MLKPTKKQLAIDLRPSSWSDFIGSEKIIKDIRDRINTGRLSNGILLGGPYGCGKTTLARLINQAIKGELVEVNASDDTGIATARLLGERAEFTPLLGEFLVILLDEAHQFTKQAQNSLLKIVEESSDTTIWIFCTTDPDKIIKGLRDRCTMSYILKGLGPADTETLLKKGLVALGVPGNHDLTELKKVLIQEGVTSPRAILNCLERFVGGMDALSSTYSSEGNQLPLEIARAAFKRDFNKVSSLLQSLTPDQAIPTLNITASYLKSVLIKNTDYAIQPWLANSILELSKDVPFDSGLSLPSLCAKLYKICNK